MTHDELAALDVAATPGPWVLVPGANSHLFDGRIEGHGGHCLAFVDGDLSHLPDEDGEPYGDLVIAPSADATLITYLRNAVPDILALIEERDRLRSLLTEARDALDHLPMRNTRSMQAADNIRAALAGEKP